MKEATFPSIHMRRPWALPLCHLRSMYIGEATITIVRGTRSVIGGYVAQYATSGRQDRRPMRARPRVRQWSWKDRVQVPGLIDRCGSAMRIRPTGMNRIEMTVTVMM